jgi:hypothetical protein
LIDQRDVGDVFEPLEIPEGADPAVPVTLGALDRRVEDVVYQR